MIVVGTSDINFYDDGDLRWIAQVLDVAVATTGQPWRVLRERLEHSTISAPKVNAILRALRLATGGGAADRTRIARRIRGMVLGAPALDDATRTARIAVACDELGLDARGIEELMWIDLANERPVVFPRGRPGARDLAAQANLDRIQREVRRARRIRVRIWDDAHELIRMARRYGLVATVSREGGATLLDILGPLALFHDTGVYGRALGEVVPLLADHTQFDLELTCDHGYGLVRTHVAPPILLPVVNADRLARSHVARLARGFDKLDVEIERDPPALAHGTDLLHPELAVRYGGRRWLVELLGFATAEHLTAKLALYDAVRIHDVALCIPAKRAPDEPDDPRVIRYDGRLEARALLLRLMES